jgi:hypothetical protein
MFAVLCCWSHTNHYILKRHIDYASTVLIFSCRVCHASCFSQNSSQHIKMDEAQRLTLQSNPLRFGRYLERNQDPQQEHAGSFHKLPSDFYLYRPFKMVADLSYDHQTILIPAYAYPSQVSMLSEVNVSLRKGSIERLWRSFMSLDFTTAKHR